MPEPAVVPLLWKHVLYLWEGVHPTTWVENRRLIFLPRTGEQVASFITLEGSFQWSLCVKNADEYNVSSISEILVTNQLTLGSVVTSGEGYECSRASVPARRPATESGHSQDKVILFQIPKIKGITSSGFSFTSIQTKKQFLLSTSITSDTCNVVS